MPITFVAVGAAGTGGSGNVSPGLPAGILAGDILILAGHSRDNIAWSVNQSFTSKIAGNAGTLSRLELWWKRVPGVVAEVGPTVTHASGNSITARIYAYRNVIPYGDPFDVVGSVQTNSASSPISTAAITTVTPGCQILHLFGSQDDNTWTTFTGSVIPTFTDRGQATDTVGTDASHGLADGRLDTKGTTGTAAATQSALGPDAGASVLAALIPGFLTTMQNYHTGGIRGGSGFKFNIERIR